MSEKRMTVSPRDAAEMLDVCLDTVLDWIKSGRLPASRLSKRIIRIRVADIDALLDRHAA
jgi:excisionase family DNA binding protein